MSFFVVLLLRDVPLEDFGGLLFGTLLVDRERFTAGLDFELSLFVLLTDSDLLPPDRFLLLPDSIDTPRFLFILSTIPLPLLPFVVMIAIFGIKYGSGLGLVPALPDEY